MSKQLKVAKIFIFALAISFFLFFDQSKHIPALVNINIFYKTSKVRLQAHSG